MCVCMCVCTLLFFAGECSCIRGRNQATAPLAFNKHFKDSAIYVFKLL